MATLRSSGSSYSVGNTPPTITWTVVKGDTSSFRTTVTNDAGEPVYIPEWDIEIKIKRPNVSRDPIEITDAATTILTLSPAATLDDLDGQFTVSLTSAESNQLAAGDIFDIQMSNSNSNEVWTIAQGSMIILEDVTD